MSKINKQAHLMLNFLGPIGSIISGYISDYMTEEELNKIQIRINTLNDKLNDFNILNYKIINRLKIRNLLTKCISEKDDVFLDLAVQILMLDEDEFENIIESFLTITKNDLDVLYLNLWKKRKLKKYNLENIGNDVFDTYGFQPDLTFSHAYCVNRKKTRFEKSVLIGDSLTIMPNQNTENIFNKFEKLSFNKFIKLAIYIPDISSDSFPSYICINFTYIGRYICKLREELDKNKI